MPLWFYPLPFFLFSALHVSAVEFVCAVAAPSAKIGLQAPESLSALVIFAQFQDEGAGESAPSWAGDLFTADMPGSFAHFYRSMSGGRLAVEGQVLPRRYRSLQGADAYLAETLGTLGGYGRFNREILALADGDIDLGLFDNDGPDRMPNSGDDDGYVDIVFINLHTVPRDFFISTATGIASLGLDADFISDDLAADGGFVRVRSRFTGFGGTTQRGHTFSVTASTMCHEFAHVLGLPDLFDQTSVTAAGELAPEEDSAGIGKWGIMGLGTLGWGVEDGPNAFSAWSLAELGWVEVVDLLLDVWDLEIDEIFSGRRIYKIALTEDEYFLLEHRQAGGSYYNRNIPQDGLLIWHVDERADNDEERHKHVDLVCADGLFADRGFPGAVEDPVEGGDNLDFWSRDDAYAQVHNGNQGDATDPFDGVRFDRFAWDTNPTFSAHMGFTRNLPLGVAVENIRRRGAVILVDVVRLELPGHIANNTMWSGRVDLDADIVVEPGAKLTIAADTEVRFARGDKRGSGFDQDRGELIVYGDLEVGSGVSFASSAARTGALDWSGIYLLDGQAANFAAIPIENAHRGLLRYRLPQGHTQWTDDQKIHADLLVPVGAELRIGPGVLAFFDRIDRSQRGISPSLVELVVEGVLTIEGEAGNLARLTTDPGLDNDGLWYGIRVMPGAQVDVRYAQLDRAGFGFSGEVDKNTGLRIADTVVRENGGNGLRLTLNGEAQIDRSLFTVITGAALRLDGSGLLRLRNSRVEDNGQEGILLNNASLEAIRVVVTNNGLLDPEDPRSGVRAVGGSGQKIEIWASEIERSTQHGLDLEEWLGEVELHDSRIGANQHDGLRAMGVERLVFEQVLVERNLRGGAVAAGSPVEIWTSTFSANIGAGLHLGPGSTGAIEMSKFRGGRGLQLQGVEQLSMRENDFVNATLGLSSDDSTPSIRLNRFTGNATAIRVEGQRVPEEIRGNIFADNATALENLSAARLDAKDNYWGTADSSAIAGQIKGAVEWAPFLPEEGAVVIVVSEVGALPANFVLYPAYPNPFNSQVTLSFDLPRSTAVELVLYDALGRPVRRLVGGALEAGAYRLGWDGRDERGKRVASGIYFIRLVAGSFAETGRIALVR